MKTRSGQRTFSLWLALIGMLSAFLAQSAPIWAKDQNGSPLVICTALGVKTIIIDENGAPVPEQPKAQKQHCALCLTTQDHDLPKRVQVKASTLITRVQSARTTAHKVTRSRFNSSHGIRAPPFENA